MTSRLHRSSLLIAGLGLLGLGLAAASAAAEPEYTAADKFRRGVMSLAYGFLEIPAGVIEQSQKDGVFRGAPIGLVDGVGRFVVRELTGVYELITAPFEVPAGFAPVMKPEFVFALFEGDRYLAQEKRSIERIAGADVWRRRGALVVRFPKHLQFGFSSAELTPAATARLDKLAEALKPYPDTQISVRGYSDSSGANAFNIALSQERAEAVFSYLVEQGIPSTRIVASGYGSVQPVANNSTLAGRRNNRRVEFEVRATGVAAAR